MSRVSGMGNDGTMRRLFRSRHVQVRRFRRRIECLLFVLCICFSFSCLAESSAGLVPTDIEAAYLYNFGKFIRFPAIPEGDQGAFAICILGEDEFHGALDSLSANEQIDGRKITVRRLNALAQTDLCQILFIAPSEESRLAKDLAAVEKKPILTVSSLPGFVQRGGMIQFLIANNRVRFAVNLGAAEKSNLSLSSELLKVAVSVDAQPALEAK